MTFVRNLENIFEKYIEGFFNKKFSSGLQPVEIAKQIVKEMSSQRSVGVSQVYVPNAYSVFLKTEDFERIAPYGSAIREELSQHIREEAKRMNYTIIGQPVVDLFLDETTTGGLLRIASQFTEPLPAEIEDTSAEASLGDTRVFDKLTVDPVACPVQKILAQAVIIAGFDQGLKTTVGARRINIGRRESNELPLTDMNTSRLHAYITLEDGRHVLHDARSLNGTYVNGQRITRRQLCAGDKIKIGNTIILYNQEG